MRPQDISHVAIESISFLASVKKLAVYAQKCSEIIVGRAVRTVVGYATDTILLRKTDKVVQVMSLAIQRMNIIMKRWVLPVTRHQSRIIDDLARPKKLIASRGPNQQ